MRTGWRWEHLGVVVAVAVSSFLFTDEEPILDLSDFNLLHVWVLVVGGLLTYFDLSLRARWGQFLYKDTVSAVAALTFSWGLFNYTRLLLLVFCLHNLTPFDADLLETLAVYQAWGAWLSINLLPSTLALCLLGASVTLLNATLGAGRGLLVLVQLLAICLLHLGAALWMVWDLALTGLSAFTAFEDADLLYGQSKSALAYDRALGAGDAFEWHKERTWPFSLRFEDLYFFFFQLLLTWDVLCSLLFWLLTLATALRNPGRGVSYTQVGTGMAWLEHVGAAVLFLYLGLASLGFRILWATPMELAF